MTATQVFCRFLKEIGMFSYYHEIVEKTINNVMHNCNDLNKISRKYNTIERKKYVIDIILKSRQLSLSSLFYYIVLPDKIGRKRMTMSSKFYDYLKKNINGNYLKVMIPDGVPQKDRYGYRNGYHELDFTLKDENKREI